MNGTHARIGANIGISIFPEHGTDAKSLLHKSDISLYAVKQCSRNHCQVYRPEFEEVLQ